MSLATWKAEYYPVPASEVPKEQAVAHSLRKWEGLREENLKRHGVSPDTRGDLVDADGNGLVIGERSCALCVHFLNRPFPNSQNAPPCNGCPLFEVRGDVSCANSTEEEQNDEESNPFDHYCYDSDHDPEPMIHWLKEAARFEAEK